MTFVSFTKIVLNIPGEFQGYTSARTFVAPRLVIGDPTVRPDSIGPEGVVVQRPDDTFGFSLTGDVALYYNPEDEPVCARPRTRNAAGGFIIKCPPFEVDAITNTAVFHVPPWLLDRSNVPGIPVTETCVCDGTEGPAMMTGGPSIGDFDLTAQATVTNPPLSYTNDPVTIARETVTPPVPPSADGWGVFKASASGSNPASWDLWRRKPIAMDPSKIKSALIYDLDTEIVQDIAALTRPIVRTSPQTPRAAAMTKIVPQTIAAEPLRLDGITVYDPLVGLIPHAALREISFICERDPANYNGDSAWGAPQVGRLWWDTSRSVYLEAQTDALDGDQDRIAREIAYRKTNWGKFAPGSSVSVWEWVKDSSGPDFNTSITVDNLQLPPFVWAREFDASLGQMVDVYYYWSLNRTVIPEGIDGRTLSAQQVAQILADPSGEGIAWMAPIMPNGMLVANIDTALDNVDSVVQIEVANSDYEGLVHYEWQLARDGDDRLPPPAEILALMNHSLCGRDDFGRPVPDPALAENDRMGASLRPRRSLVAADDAGMRAARASFVGIVNAIFGATNMTTQNPAIADDLTRATPTYPALVWTQPSGSSAIEPPPLNAYDFVASSLAERDAILTSHAYRIACGYRSPALGFDPRVCIRARSPRILVTNYDAPTPSWSIWEVPPNAFGTNAAISFPATTLVLSAAYDRSFPTYADLVEAIAIGQIADGQRCLIEADERAGDLWTIYYYAPFSVEASDDGLVFETAQTYRTRDFVSIIDWYAEGYSALNPPLVSYASIARRNIVEGPNPTNTLVRIDDDSTGRWIWTAFEGGHWTTVAEQNGTVALSSKFAEANRPLYLGLEDQLSSVTSRDGTLELRQIETALRETILTKSQINEVFFSLLHFVHTRQEQVNWAFKTSFLSIVGFNERLTQSPVATVDTTQNLIDYVNEVKPYRVKMRDFTRILTSLDTVTTQAYDFDKPVYFDTATQSYRRLDPAVPMDMRLMANMAPYAAWASVYQKTGTDPTTLAYNPVRKIRTTLRFDRINIGMSTPTDSVTPWDLVPHDVLAYDADGTHTDDDEYSALARLIAWYEPGTNMVAKDQTDELLDQGFKGTIIDGGTFAGSPGDPPIDGNPMSGTFDVVINPEAPGQAYGMRDPHHEGGRPPELVAALVNVGLAITARSLWVPGAPAQDCAFVTTRGARRSTIALPYRTIAACADAVMVYRDGVRAIPGTDYTVDHAARVVTYNLSSQGKPKTLEVQAFGVSATGAVTDQAFYRGDGTTLTFLLHGGAPTGPVTVSVDGSPLDVEEWSVVGSTVTLAQAPADGSFVLIVAMAAGAIPTLPHREVLAYTGDQTWTLSTATTTFPATSGTIVEVEGLRLTPPFTRYGSFAGGNRTIVLGRVIANIANLTVYLDGLPYSGTVAYFASDDDAGAQGELPSGLVVIADELHATDPAITASHVIAVIKEQHDFDITEGPSGSILTVLKPLGAILSDPTGLRIEATRFSGDALMGIETHVFSGSPGGAYPVPTAASADGIVVWVDGMRLVAGHDYALTDDSVGAYAADNDGIVGFDPGGVTIVTVPGGQDPASVVLVTAYAGTRARPDAKWRMLSAVPGPALTGGRCLTEVRDADNAGSGPPGSTVVMTAVSSQGPRSLYRLDGSYEVFEASQWDRMVLGADLLPGDDSLTVTLNPDGLNPKLMTTMPLSIPDLDAGTPGVIQVGTERIEYFALDQSGNTVALSQLRRGARLTPRGLRRPISAVLLGDGATKTLLLAGATGYVPIEVGLRAADGQVTPLHLSDDFTSTQQDDGVLITLLGPAPALGTSAYAVQDQVPMHVRGEAVINVTPRTHDERGSPFRRRDILDVVQAEPDQTVYRA